MLKNMIWTTVSLLLAGKSLAEVTHHSASKNLRVSLKHHIFMSILSLTCYNFLIRSLSVASHSSAWLAKVWTMTICKLISLRLVTRSNSKERLWKRSTSSSTRTKLSTFSCLTPKKTTTVTSRRVNSGLTTAMPWCVTSLAKMASSTNKSKNGTPWMTHFCR